MLFRSALLPDPKFDRQLKAVNLPVHLPLTEELLFGPDSEIGDRKPNWKVLHNHFFKEGRLLKVHILEIIGRAMQIFSMNLYEEIEKEPNAIKIDDPITVVGDIHGQFYDLEKIFEIGGDPLKRKYLFLGDYIDRGCFSLETILTLYAIKVLNLNQNRLMLQIR